MRLGYRSSRLIFITLVFCSRPALAEDQRLAVMPLGHLNVDKSVVTIMEQILVAEVDRLPGFQVISAADINAMIGLERMKDAVDCSDATCAAEIGGALDASLMISGSIGTLGEALTISLVLFDVRNVVVKKRVFERIRNDENLYAGAIAKAADGLFPQLATLREQNAESGEETKTDRDRFAIELARSQQELDRDASLTAEQTKYFARLKDAVADPSLERSRKIALIDAFLEQVSPETGLHDQAVKLRDETWLGVGGLGTLWLQAAFSWPAGIRVEGGRVRWTNFQFSGLLFNLGWFYSLGPDVAEGMFFGVGIAGVGAKGQSRLGDTVFEWGVMAWPLYFGQWFGQNTSGQDTPIAINSLGGLIFSPLCPYLALNFGGVHVELGAQLPVAWSNGRKFFGGSPPLLAYIGGGY